MNYYFNKSTGNGIAKIDLYSCIQSRQGSATSQNNCADDLVLILDISSSMQQKHDGTPLIESVKRAACNLIDQYPERGVRVLAFDNRLVVFGEQQNTELATSPAPKLQPFQGLNLFRTAADCDPAEVPLPMYTDGHMPVVDWSAARSPEQKEEYKKRIRALKSRGATSFVSACMFAVNHASDRSSVVALTDGLSNCGLGFERCPDVGVLFRDKCMQFSLVIPFSDVNYCDLESLKPLYTLCDGDVLYPKAAEIESAFAESQTPIAFNAILRVSGEHETLPDIRVSKVTKSSAVYIRFGISKPIASDTPCCVIRQ